MEEIYNFLTKGIRKPKHKVAIFLCGAAGTGKTSSKETFLDDAKIKTTFVNINIDEIRPMVGTQEEARKVLVSIFNNAVNDGYSILYDGTCRDKTNILNRIKFLKENQYKIILGITYTSLNTALKRIQERTDQPLDETIARDIYLHLKRNVETYMKLDDIDEVYLYNNEKLTKLVFTRKLKRISCISPNSNFYFDISKYC